jgi:beta-mannosidase
MNEADMQWVGEREWEIARSFTLDRAALDQRWPVLELEFVDTFSDVFVNGSLAARLGSSFVRHRIDLSGLLVEGENELRIRFFPPGAEASRLAALQPFPIPWSVSNNRVPDLNMIRKAQCHGGWDWGPCLLVSGIYAPPVLHLYETARIESVQIRQQHQADGRILAIAEIELAANGEASLPISFELCGRRTEATVTVTPAGTKARLELDVGTPALWWPAGHGEQPLHEAVVTIPGDRAVRRIGFRTLEVVTEKDEAGASMIFRVNGIDIFCKGANWIPADALPSAITADRVRALLSAAVEANMNMIRVWGGGFYEFDLFYDLCDELGLLVWQDMMFSCSQYPSTPEFLETVDAELRYQIKRLSSRPSIAIWCGDNEVIGSLSWYELSLNNRDRYLVNYDRLNRVIEKAVLDTDPSRRFWPSSPCNGDLDYGDAWHDDGSGDIHFWDVWHSNKNFEHYYTVKPRFCSEFGFQSFSSSDVAKTYVAPDQMNPTAPDFEHHQKNRGGNARILETMARYFRFPEGYESVLYLSQVQQALAIKTGVEAWRHLQPRCMGTLFWQLNDNWPVASWSSVEYGGKWKHLQYHAKRFYAPVAVMVVPADNDPTNIEVWAVNDRAAPARAEAAVELWSFDGSKLDTQTLTAEIAPRSACLLGKLPVSDFGTDSERQQRFLEVVLTANVGGQTEKHRNEWYFDFFKRCDLGDARVDAIPAERNGKWTVTLTTDKPAFFVWANVSGIRGEFDDNSFSLFPGRPAVLTFTPKDAQATFADFARALTIKHLRQTYAGRR